MLFSSLFFLSRLNYRVAHLGSLSFSLLFLLPSFRSLCSLCREREGGRWIRSENIFDVNIIEKMTLFNSFISSLFCFWGQINLEHRSFELNTNTFSFVPLFSLLYSKWISLIKYSCHVMQNKTSSSYSSSLEHWEFLSRNKLVKELSNSFLFFPFDEEEM